MFFVRAKKRVLVIDDDPTLQLQVSIRLEWRDGLDIVQAIDGEDGLALATDTTPDLIILDWMLPDILGPEVLVKLSLCDVTRHIPILMLTRRNKVGDIDDAFGLGAKGYLTKPFTLQRLSDKVAEMLKRSKRE